MVGVLREFGGQLLPKALDVIGFTLGETVAMNECVSKNKGKLMFSQMACENIADRL